MAGLYAHIPFCSVKCWYCDFTAFSGQGKQAGRYLEALSAEARLRRGEWGVLAALPTPATLYIGGGTPSELDAGGLERLFGILKDLHPEPFEEATFEANPESLDPAKARQLKDLGVTRLSLGLQAGQDRLLKALGRQHDLARFQEVYAAARKEGPASINVDLMFGLPDQTAADWEDTLAYVSKLSPDHVSLYGLKVEARTVFSKRKVRADEDIGAIMYTAAVDKLTTSGYRHYEISNFAQPGHESRHNMTYWSDGPYLGLGCGATSYVGGERRTNLDGIAPYCEALEKGRSPVLESERLEGKAKLGEAVILALRRVQVGAKLAPEVLEAFAPAFQRLEDQGLVELACGHAKLTRRGLLLANQAFLEFVPPYY